MRQKKNVIALVKSTHFSRWRFRNCPQLKNRPKVKNLTHSTQRKTGRVLKVFESLVFRIHFHFLIWRFAHPGVFSPACMPQFISFEDIRNGKKIAL